ncbi:hypothetical protein QTH97_26245 [Variovorax sp. J22R24]|uniref:hypothetical protein n=1 Tax=Variovorax gracilis TaxID=3053502 RepID=UPI0025752E81|nr:hypothetical protein [Variovorax sp. J22R24]MDM0108477.1 hypothetical protein [Variovorax sp. J22R24]
MQDLMHSDPRAFEAWQRDARKEVDRNLCAEGSLLYFAVQNGNLEVVTWLLDAGINPSGTDSGTVRNTIFSACPVSYSGKKRPDGLTFEDVMPRTVKAYQLLVSRGGDLNRVEAWGENALMVCRNEAMWPILIELGVSRSPQGDKKNVRLAVLQDAVNGALSYDQARAPAALRKAQLLAINGFNDLRGTTVEKSVFEACKRPERRATCEVLAKLIYFSPGTFDPSFARYSFPGGADEKPKEKEICFFPELQVYTEDLDVLPVLGTKGKALDAAFNWREGEVRQHDIAVRHRARPVILYLRSKQPALWNVRYATDSRIAAVIIDPKPYGAQSKVIGLPPTTPVYLGALCNASFLDRDIPTLHRNKDIDPGSLDPLARHQRKPIAALLAEKDVIGDGQTIGALSPSEAWTLEGIGASTTKPRVLEGREQLEYLVKKGQLRRSNAQVFLRWAQEARGAWWGLGRIPRTVPPFWDGYYLVDGASRAYLTLPGGLKGPDAPVLFVPETAGISGDPADATIFYMEASNGDHRFPQGRCQGPRC